MNGLCGRVPALRSGPGCAPRRAANYAAQRGQAAAARHVSMRFVSRGCARGGVLPLRARIPHAGGYGSRVIPRNLSIRPSQLISSHRIHPPQLPPRRPIDPIRLISPASRPPTSPCGRIPSPESPPSSSRSAVVPVRRATATRPRSPSAESPLFILRWRLYWRRVRAALTPRRRGQGGELQIAGDRAGSGA